MLIEFRVANFRSFRDSQTLSMIAANFTEHVATNTFDSGLPGFGRFLRSAAIYGPNAAGKSNLLLALQWMQAFVLQSSTAAPTAGHLYQPFKLASATREAPSEFQVTFVQDRIRYEYGFLIDATRVCREWLVQYIKPRGRVIFDRTFDGKKEKYIWKYSTYFKGQRSVWSEATRPNALFLSTAVQLNSEQLLPVFQWFQKRLVVIAGATSLNPTLTLKLLDQPDGKEKLLPFLREADLGIADVEMKREIMPTGSNQIMVFGPPPILEQTPGSPTPNLVRITFTHRTSEQEHVGFDLMEESAGTQILFRHAGAWLNVFANGEVLLFDEIDTSLHPLLTQFLIKKFHSDNTNPHNAQLIFISHNTSLLSQDLFRRDQIWFFEKNQDGASHLYPLSDFKPRNDESLERWYMRGRYGALPILGESQK